MKIRVALYFSTVAKPLCVELPNDVVDLVDWGSEVITRPPPRHSQCHATPIKSAIHH